MLTKTNLKQGQDLAKKLYLKHPEHPAVITTYSFALYSENQPQAAADTLDQLIQTSSQLPAASHLYYALSLNKLGKHNLARAQLPHIQASQLLAEESKLLESLRSSLAEY